MDEYNSIVGKRLQEIRKSFNEGTKLSVSQFAHLLGTTRDKITNYENGRSALPVSILYALYIRGISPVYIISGDGHIYADNTAGNLLKERIESKKSESNLRKDIFRLDDERYRVSRDVYKSAAGKIKK
jgi:transcriptional regulator with XRE-family HTH domain